jgi:RNA polymerase subunit RPABC4/transcription elongation factor Spt4
MNDHEKCSDDCDICHEAFVTSEWRVYKENNALVQFAPKYCPECGVKL